ncbi:hypothetical protein [Succinivibrio sp.]|uniref:hypothetical protein n=1 Tax=Succinivibrio sp. TaxID=2053619 RepID=UPI00258E2F22|nr:hypothetical protein [Succinivibrio sp.]MDD6205727.1 hypothetical protein [Succinivibrio sp.]
MDLKLLLIVATMSAVIGSCFGITITAKHYRAEIINLQAEAIKTEQDALVKQLNIEHEWQAKQEQADKEATDEINKIKDKYNAAMSKLHANSLHTDSGSANRTTLSTNTTSTRKAQATCECEQLRQDRRTLAEYALKLSAKCDEIAVERNELSKRYSALK